MTRSRFAVRTLPLRIGAGSAVLFLTAPVALGQSATFQGLGLPMFSVSARAHAVSADGSTVTGEAKYAGGTRAFRWTQAGGMQVLDVLPGFLDGVGTGVSADGAIVVGYCHDHSPTPGNGRAFRDEETERRSEGGRGAPWWTRRAHPYGAMIHGHPATNAVWKQPKSATVRTPSALQSG